MSLVEEEPLSPGLNHRYKTDYPQKAWVILLPGEIHDAPIGLATGIEIFRTRHTILILIDRLRWVNIFFEADVFFRSHSGPSEKSASKLCLTTLLTLDLTGCCSHDKLAN